MPSFWGNMGTKHYAAFQTFFPFQQSRGLLKGSFLGSSFQHARNQPFNCGQWYTFVGPITQASGCGEGSENLSSHRRSQVPLPTSVLLFQAPLQMIWKATFPHFSLSISIITVISHHRYLEEFKQRAALCTKVWAAKGSGRWGLVIHAVSFAHRFWQKSLFQQGRICTSAGTCDLSASLLVPTRSKLGAKLINSDESIRADRRLAALPQINSWVVRGAAGKQAQSQILIGAVWAFAGVEVRKRTDRQTCLLQTANLS